MNDRPPKKQPPIHEIEVDPVTLLAIVVALLFLPILIVGFFN
jgi:hypothetical protein